MNRKNLFLLTIVFLAAAAVTLSAGGAGEKPAGKVVLKILDLNPEGGPAIEAAAKLVMARYPGVEIQHTAMNSRQYDQRIQALAASGDMPDIPTVQMFPQYKGMAQNNLFTDLRDSEVVKSGIFYDLALSSMTLQDGTVYGLSWNYLAVGAFYNKDIFAKYNLDIPKDWDAFLQVCETLKENGVTPIVSPLGDGWTSQYPLYTAGDNLLYAKDPNYDKELLAGEKKFNDPLWVETWERVKTLYDQGYFGDNAMGGKYEQSCSDFANGKGAMLILGSWIIPLLSQLNPNLHFSMFPVPFNDKGEKLYAMFESELGMAIAKTSKHQKEALEFFKHFYEKEPYETYLRGKKGFSNIKGINVAFDPSAQYIADNYLVPGLTFPYMSRVWPAGQDILMFKLFQQVMLGQMTIPSALDEMDKFFQENRK
jgi:raffinose/stachyose/melibiose transport system substrate-binding protein